MTRVRLRTIVSKLRFKLSTILGDRLVGVFLYGSQARGEAKDDSDIDILVVTNGKFDNFRLVEETGQLVADLSLEYDTVISLAFVSEEDYSSVKHRF